MSCEKYQEMIVSHLADEIDRENETELQQHLEACDPCRQTQLEFRALKGLMGRLPAREWDEKLRIRDLLRSRRRWQKIVFSKAALWLISLTALIAVISSLPVRWELTAQDFSMHWGRSQANEADVSTELKRLQVQLQTLQQQNQQYHQSSEMRIKELVQQNNVEQQKRYFQTLQMFANYLQLERKADLQKIQHDIATTYDRTGQQVDKTNELLDYVLRTSATEGSIDGH
jgi:putative zinc finger protein